MRKSLGAGPWQTVLSIGIVELWDATRRCLVQVILSGLAYSQLLKSTWKNRRGSAYWSDDFKGLTYAFFRLACYEKVASQESGFQYGILDLYMAAKEDLWPLSALLCKNQKPVS